VIPFLWTMKGDFFLYCLCYLVSLGMAAIYIPWGLYKVTHSGDEWNRHKFWEGLLMITMGVLFPFLGQYMIIGMFGLAAIGFMLWIILSIFPEIEHLPKIILLLLKKKEGE
jgi:hypothetical protein